MAIRGVLRSGFMQLRVLNMDESLEFYKNILGMYEVGRTGDGRVCLKAWDEFDHHSLTLRQTDTAGMDFMGFKVLEDADLDRIAEDTKAFGLECSWIDADTDQPGFGRRLAVNLPTGHRIDIYAKTDQTEPHPQVHNPEIWPVEPHGIGVNSFDHALLFGPNAKDTVRYFNEVLGLAIAEVCRKPDGDDLCTWMTGSNRAHDVAVLDYEEPGKLHHVAYKLGTWQDIGHAADLMSINEIDIDAGPMRHGVTRGHTIYFFDPSGNRIEVYAGGYAHYPDQPLRIWDLDQVGKGIFYYERKLNDNFLSVLT